MKETLKETTYFKITTINSLFLVEISKDFINWKLILRSEFDSYHIISDFVVSYIISNNLTYNYQIISDFNISFRINNDIHHHITT